MVLTLWRNMINSGHELFLSSAYEVNNHPTFHWTIKVYAWGMRGVDALNLESAIRY